MRTKVLWILSENEQPYQGDSNFGHPPLTVGPESALGYVETESLDAIILHSPVDGWLAADFVQELHRKQPHLPIIVRSGNADLTEAVELTKAGAFHVMHRDAPDNELNAAIGAALAWQPAKDRMPPRPESCREEVWRRALVGRSSCMQELAEFIRLVGPRRSTVLITGETGTGKELVARALHSASPRANLPLISLNCAALPEHLLEGELFGHVRGAYTGAITNRTGRFEQANHGTLFLDEIADLPFDLQAKLLRVLQEREIQRLGGSEIIRVDVRVIAACNVDLLARVREGRFREDLYYRLAVVPVAVAPLRERTSDIPALVDHFIRRVSEQEELPGKRLTTDSIQLLMNYEWPGNVRQLENLIEMAMILSGERRLLYPADFRLPPSPKPAAPVAFTAPSIPVPDKGLDFERTVGQIELGILEQALRKTHGNKKQAADMLGLKRTTLAAKLKSLEVLTGETL